MGRRAHRAAQRAAIRSTEVRLGYVNGVFGLQGEVRLFLYNPKTELFSGVGMDVVLVSLDGQRLVKRLTARSGAGKRILGRLTAVNNPEDAAHFVEWEIVCAEDALPALSSGEYYHRDLIGLAVHTESGEPVGRLSEIVEGEHVDCWIATSDEGEFMFPAVREVVLSVDLHAGVVIADDMEAMET